MKYDAILFDLDGTLLPMDNDAFVKGYLGHLTKAVAHLGYNADEMIAAMWKGVAGMIKNDGSKRNSEVFWKVFSSYFGDKVYDDIPVFDEFYKTDFNKAKEYTGENEYAREIVTLAHEKADKVILATNPMFPAVAVDTRLSWIGLSSADFDYITTYENSGSCKPNPLYYTEILENLSLKADNCLMIGNNTDEDAAAAMKVGMGVYLVTNHLIAGESNPDCPSGTYPELVEFLKML